MKLLPSLALTILCLVLIMGQASAYEYVFKGSTAVVYNANSDFVVPFNYSGTCTVQMESVSTFTAPTAFDSNFVYYSAPSIVHTTSTLTGISNTSCLSYGMTNTKSAVKLGVTDVIQPIITYTQAATAGFVHSDVYYHCAPNSGDNAIFTIDGTTNLTNCMWRNTLETTGSNQRLSYYASAVTGYTDKCNTFIRFINSSCTKSGSFGGTGNHLTVTWFYPFNSSGSTSIPYSMTSFTSSYGPFTGCGTSTNPVTYYYDLIDVETGTVFNLGSGTQSIGLLSSTFTFPALSGTLSVTENKQYIFAITEDAAMTFPACTMTHASNGMTALTLNISTYQPQWSCGAFSECVNGVQSQTCTDLTGKVPDKVESLLCEVAPTFSYPLGFEEGYYVTTQQCRKSRVYSYPWDCSFYFVANQTRIYPHNWTVLTSPSFLAHEVKNDYITLTDETASGGTLRSLKMWWLAPNEGRVDINPLTNGTVCGNISTGAGATIERGDINQSLFVSYNITFPVPYPNVKLSFDYKKCKTSQVNYEDLAIGGCGTYCYGSGGNCSVSPRGSLNVYFEGAGISDSLVKHLSNDDFSLNWDKFAIFLNNKNLQANSTYTLTFELAPDDIYDPNAYCIYLDNVSLNFYSQELSVCTSQCAGIEYVVRELVNDYCVEKRIQNYPDCVAEGLQDIIANCTSGCYNGLLYTYQLKNTGECVFISAVETPTCITQNNAKNFTESMNEPIKFLEDIGLINRTYYASAGLTWSLFLFSPTFVLFLLALLISGGITFYVRTTPHAGMFGIIIFFMMMSIYAIGGLYPPWFIIMEIIIAAFLLARFMISNQRGG